MTETEEMIFLLKSIDRRLALLTASQERELRSTLERDLLRTDGRIKMFDAIDGEHTSPDIAKIAGVSERAVQLFAKELMDSGLVRDTGLGAGRAVVVERDEAAIVAWFTTRQALATKG